MSPQLFFISDTCSPGIIDYSLSFRSLVIAKTCVEVVIPGWPNPGPLPHTVCPAYKVYMYLTQSARHIKYCIASWKWWERRSLHAREHHSKRTPLQPLLRGTTVIHIHTHGKNLRPTELKPTFYRRPAKWVVGV